MKKSHVHWRLQKLLDNPYKPMIVNIDESNMAPLVPNMLSDKLNWLELCLSIVYPELL